jgi:hypothetical protein
MNFEEWMMSPEEARYSGLRAMGGMTQIEQ